MGKSTHTHPPTNEPGKEPTTANHKTNLILHTAKSEFTRVCEELEFV